MDKIGLAVDPTDADLSGQPGCGTEAENPHAGSENRTRLTCGVHLHAVGDGGVTVRRGAAGDSREAGGWMRTVSLDSALVSIGPADPVYMT